MNVKMDERKDGRTLHTTISSCWMVVAVTRTVVKVLLTLGTSSDDMPDSK